MNNKQITEVLSGGLPRAARDESIPRFLELNYPVLGGKLRARRYEPEQTMAIRQQLLEVGCRTWLYDVAEFGRPLAIKICHICLVRMDAAILLFPGDEGKQQLEVLTDAELQELARRILTHNKVFGAASIDDKPLDQDSGPDEDTELDE